MDNGVTKRRGESMTFEGKEYDVGRLLDALEEGNGDANPKSVFLFFFCRTSLATRGAGAVEVSLLGLMTKAAFDREWAAIFFCKCFLLAPTTRWCIVAIY